MEAWDERNRRYLKILVDPIRVCARYLPKFGQGAGAGLSVSEFQQLYGSDQFYSWFGLDNPMMYAAHKAAGGITSVYRQIGIAGERFFREVLKDELGLTEAQSNWSYMVNAEGGRTRKLKLDGRIELNHVADAAKRLRVQEWMERASEDLSVEGGIRERLKGVVFEVRQGYKSKDSKRQNADIANAANAYAGAYLPCVAVLSAQIDGDIMLRYRNAKWAMLTGRGDAASDIRSTYTFMKDVVGFNMAEFFVQHSDTLKAEVAQVLERLLAAEG